MIKVGGKQKPYEMWQAGISLAALPLANSSWALPEREYGGSAARPLTLRRLGSSQTLIKCCIWTGYDMSCVFHAVLEF